jgi:hypothetical protein
MGGIRASLVAMALGLAGNAAGAAEVPPTAFYFVPQRPARSLQLRGRLVRLSRPRSGSNRFRTALRQGLDEQQRRDRLRAQPGGRLLQA